VIGKVSDLLTSAVPLSLRGRIVRVVEVPDALLRPRD